MSASGPDVPLREWLEGRRPPVPAAFLTRLLGGEEGPSVSSPPEPSPLARVRPALRGALAREGERRGAFRLLAADAWITYACEVALASEDPPAELLQVLSEVLAAAEGP